MWNTLDRWYSCGTSVLNAHRAHHLPGASRQTELHLYAVPKQVDALNSRYEIRTIFCINTDNHGSILQADNPVGSFVLILARVTKSAPFSGASQLSARSP